MPRGVGVFVYMALRLLTDEGVDEGRTIRHDSIRRSPQLYYDRGYNALANVWRTDWISGNPTQAWVGYVPPTGLTRAAYRTIASRLQTALWHCYQIAMQQRAQAILDNQQSSQREKLVAQAYLDENTVRDDQGNVVLQDGTPLTESRLAEARIRDMRLPNWSFDGNAQTIITLLRDA